MAIDDGGQAYPCEMGYVKDGTWTHKWLPGMTLRDAFAMAAMQGRIITPDVDSDVPLVAWAYAQADAMIVERAKEEA